MKRILILALVILLTIDMVGAIPVNNCKTISTAGSYELITDIKNISSASCINITSSNVIFDGKGYLIDGMDNPKTYGIHVFNPSKTITNITVKNINTAEWDHGIYYHNTKIGNITNNTANLGFYGAGIALENSTYISIQKNKNSESRHGISLLNSSNNKLDNNNVSLSLSTGIMLEMDSNINTITNNNVSDNDVGISVGDSIGNIITNNIVGRTYYGIELEYSSFNSIKNNNIFLNQYGIELVAADNNTLDRNNLKYNKNTGIYLVLTGSKNNNITNNTVLYNNNGIVLDRATNNLLSNNIVGRNALGISIGSFGSYGNILDNNNIYSNDNGIYLNSYKNIIKNNTVKNNTNNIKLSDSNNNILLNNSIYNFGYYGYGIYLNNSANNIMDRNIIRSNENGIYLSYSEFNTIKTNRIYNNGPITGTGIFIYFSNSNIIYNNYLNNSNNHNFAAATNRWNVSKISGLNILNGPYIGGNFWAFPNGFGYSQKCADNNKDGICDLAYTFDGNSDYYPLTIDKGPPRSITLLKNITYKPTYINWTWKDPSDADFSKVIVYIDDKFKTNITKGIQKYNLTGLLPNTLHKISTHTVDINGNINKTWVNKTSTTSKDKIPPKSIINLKNITYKPTYINWTWKDPSDIDFTKVIIYINNKFKTNITKGIQKYNLTGLLPNTLYRISTHTVDTSGNINKTWVNNTAKTSPLVRVNITGFAFDPLTTSISKGTTVMWINLDPANHTVTSDTGVFDSGDIPRGQVYSRQFNTAGTFDYHCTIHPFMTGTVKVS